MSETEKDQRDGSVGKGVYHQDYDLSLIPRTYTVGGRTDAYKLSSCVHCGTHTLVIKRIFKEREVYF